LAKALRKTANFIQATQLYAESVDIMKRPKPKGTGTLIEEVEVQKLTSETPLHFRSQEHPRGSEGTSHAKETTTHDHDAETTTHGSIVNFISKLAITPSSAKNGRRPSMILLTRDK